MNRNLLLLSVSLAVLMINPVAAQSNTDAKPGMVGPGSPFYGLETAWDNLAVNSGIKSVGAVAKERAAEAREMAEKNRTRNMNKALRRMNKTLGKAKEKDSDDLAQAEDILNQVRNRAPENAREGLDNAIGNVRRARAAAGEKRGPGEGTGDTGPRNPETTPKGQNNSARSGTGSGSVQGKLELMVSDRPVEITRFDYLNTTFDNARIFASGQAENGYVTVELPETTVDLTTVQGEKAEMIAEIPLEPGDYSKIELYTSRIEASVNGTDVEVKAPPEKLMINKPFTVDSNSTTSFVFDIQIVLRGNEQNNQGYILQPLISESGVAGKDVEVERK